MRLNHEEDEIEDDYDESEPLRRMRYNHEENEIEDDDDKKEMRVRMTMR